jgi:hypothetical protein
LKVLVCGGRAFNDVDFIFSEHDRLHAQYCFRMLIEGDARGVDRVAEEWASARKVEPVEFPADWAKDGRHAALIRNDRMLSDGKPDLVKISRPEGVFSMLTLQNFVVLKSTISAIRSWTC